jgi:phospholipid transport system transporter-binding protein
MKTPDKTAHLRIEGNIFFLEGVLDFDSVVPLLPLLKNAMKQLDVVEVDLAAVTYTNSAGVALLLDILRKAQDKKITVNYKNIPKDMQDIINLSGLQDVLAKPASV